MPRDTAPRTFGFVRHRVFLVPIAAAFGLACSSDEFAGNDGGSDAIADGTSGDAVSVFCVGYPDVTLCDDFDRTETGGGGFKPLYKPTTANGFLTRVTDAVSPSYALDAQLSSGVATAFLKYNTNLGAASRMQLHAKVKPTAGCADGTALTTIGAGDQLYTVSLSKVGARDTLHVLVEKQAGDAAPSFSADGTNTIAFDAWADFDVDVRVAPPDDAGVPQHDVSLKWGGEVALTVRIPGPALLTSPVLNFGARADGKSCHVGWDNLIFDVTP